MAKVTIQGMGTFNNKLDLLARDIERINNLALYSAAELAAQAMSEALQALPVRDDDEWGTEQRPLYGATASEKAQIIDNFGVAKFRHSTNGSQTSIGFHGYVETPSSRFNDQVPTGMLMQCIEYGTRFRHGTHTVNNATKRVKDAAIQRAQERIDQEVKKIMD